jgi:hypothetical protein
MTSLSVATESPRARPARRPFLPLVNADLLKLRRNRGLVAVAAAMTIGGMVIAYGILAILHAANPAHHGPAGGVENLGHGIGLLALLGSAAAILAGARAGAGDLSSGVFRELVITGRSRLALFAARVPGGLAFLLPLVAIAVVIAAAATVGFAGTLPSPSAGLLAEAGLWVTIDVGFYFALALGLASLIGSRAQTVGILLAWRLALAPLLVSIGALGPGRDALPQAAFERLAPQALNEYIRQGPVVSMSAATAVLTIVLWTGVALGLGAWRTVTRDA